VVAAPECVVVGEGQLRGVDFPVVGVEQAQPESVVFALVVGGGEVDAQPECGSWFGGGVVGVADDGAVRVGQGEMVGEELFGVQGQDGSRGGLQRNGGKQRSVSASGVVVGRVTLAESC
jgi:hypothetical protein